MTEPKALARIAGLILGILFIAGSSQFLGECKTPWIVWAATVSSTAVIAGSLGYFIGAKKEMA